MLLQPKKGLKESGLIWLMNCVCGMFYRWKAFSLDEWSCVVVITTTPVDGQIGGIQIKAVDWNFFRKKITGMVRGLFGTKEWCFKWLIFGFKMERITYHSVPGKEFRHLLLRSLEILSVHATFKAWIVIYGCLDQLT